MKQETLDQARRNGIIGANNEMPVRISLSFPRRSENGLEPQARAHKKA
jgi:hypothetical protein